MSENLNYNKKVMDDLLKLVHDGFDWYLSDEGVQYWSIFIHNLVNLLKVHGGLLPQLGTDTKQRKPSAEDYDKMNDLLIRAFALEQTPQGNEFWRKYCFDFAEKAYQLREENSKNSERKEIMNNKIEQWIKDKKGNKIGYLVAQNFKDGFRIGFSKCHRKLDEFNKETAKKIAKERLFWNEPQIPQSLKKELINFYERADKYFKDCTASKQGINILKELGYIS